MDNNKRVLLQRHKQDIINDLDVKFVLDELYTKHAISIEDCDQISGLQNRADRTRYLLDTLIRSGSNSDFEAFVDSLKKDYSWLWEKLAIENSHSMVNDSFEDSLSKGDVPRLPEHHVRRKELEQNVADKLKNLARHKILVLHGMSGSGKTCVAISALRHNPELITNDLNGVIFWLNFGNCTTDDDILAQQNKLLRKASTIYTLNSFMNSSISMSSIGSNADSNSLSNYNWKWEDLRDTLKAQFSEQPLKESLLVLDEVNEKRIVEAFDVGCKILITTRDTDVVANYHPLIVKIENSLLERESLEIFASCLEVPVSKLPSQAKKLHEICKGSPFHIGLIGAQLAENRERLIDDPERWNYYLKKLKKKEYFFMSKYQSYNPMKTIEICINSLNVNIQPLFKKLKILPDNCKVSAKVLSKLWNKEVSEVELIMKELRSKSLIMEYYDRELRNYMYEIHDLIMNYLRSTEDEDSKKLNVDFLNSYYYDVTHTPVEIIDDGYIAFYIGYHIKNTSNMNNKWSLFNKLYMNLKFLGNKVRLTGSADVILDLQKYEQNISKDEIDRELIHSIQAFLRTHGRDLYVYPCTDIVQSILQHESKGILYTKAAHIAQENCARNELYFEFLHEPNVEEIKHSTIDVKENITAVCFLGDYVLIGTSSGMIKFFYIPTNKLRKELRGTGSPIKWVGVACTKNPPIVAALSYDGVIKLWPVDDVDQEETDDIIEEPEEPYNNNYTDVVTIQPKLGPYINCRWSNNEEFLVMHTKKMIVLYNPSLSNGRKIMKTIDDFHDRCITCCGLCNRDRYIFVATEGNSNNVEVIDVKNKDRVITFQESDLVLDMVTVPGSNKVITLKSNEITEHEIKISPNTIKSNNTYRSKRIISSEQMQGNLNFISIAVNKTGTLLFVSTNDSRIVCIDLKTYSNFNLENRRGNVVAMAVSEVMWDEFLPGSDVLLTGTGSMEDSAKVWYLDASYVSQKAKENGKVRLTTKFDVSFLQPTTPNSPTATNSGTDSSTNTPKRHQSFANHKEVTKKMLKNSMSLDRQSLKPLNLKGINCNNNDGVMQPLLAVVDDKNYIQVMRGRKVLTKIAEKSDESITRVKISPCNQYVIYGLKSGAVKRFTLRTKEIDTIMDVYSPVKYLNFVNPHMLIVAGKNRCLMVYRLSIDGSWKLEMLQKGNSHLGSQEILNDLQGVKKMNGQEKISSSSSEASLTSRDRQFPSSETKNLCKGSVIVDCFWIPDLGLVTVEYNATIKLWDRTLKLSTILNGRQPDVQITTAAFQNNILVVCDKYSMGFQTFELKVYDGVDAELHSIQDYRLNKEIVSCDLTSDGNILAMGLDSGNVVIWNVKGKHQFRLLKHHKTKVNYCSFSPVPERRSRNSLGQSPLPGSQPADSYEDPPLVLVTMATEVVWWNITFVLNLVNKGVRRPVNAMTPLGSPMEVRYEHQQSGDQACPNSSKANFFFGDGYFLPQHCWKAIWKGKTCKEGSKKKEILACIKLSGVNAKTLRHDDKFSCFVTVDNPGQVHIMNVMMTNNT